MLAHSVYILAQRGRASPRRQTYTGYSANVPRRVNEDHNREACAATSADGPWDLGAVIAPFRSRNAALAFESRLQHEPARGLRQNVAQARALAAGDFANQGVTVEEVAQTDQRLVARPLPPPSKFDKVRGLPKSFLSPTMKRLTMGRLQFISSALSFNLADNDAPFYILPEFALGQMRFHVVFAEPQDALGPSCLALLDFLHEHMDYPASVSLEFKLDIAGVEQYAYHLDRWFDGHEAAGLEQGSVLSDANVLGRRGLKLLLSRFVEDRNTVLERYGQADERYRRVSELRVTIGRVGFGPRENPLAGLEQHRQNHRVREVAAPYGDCVWQCLIESLDKVEVQRRSGKIWLPSHLANVSALRELCGLTHLEGQPVCYEDMEQIAERLVWKQTNGENAPLRGVRLYLYDFNLSLQRVLPAPREYDDSEDIPTRQDVHIIHKNGHACLWQNAGETRLNVRRALSLYTAYVEARTGQSFEDYIDAMYPDDEMSLQDRRLELFCRYQHLQPNESAIEHALQEDIGGGPVLETVELVPCCNNYLYVPTERPNLWPGGAQRAVLKPGGGKNGSMDKSCTIIATGLEYRCSQVEPKISKVRMNDVQVIEDRIEELEAVTPYFPPAKEEFCMDYNLTFDIETASLADGTFYTYAIGWTIGGDSTVHTRVASTVEQLDGGLMEAVLEEWAAKAKEMDAQWRANKMTEAESLGLKALRKLVKRAVEDSSEGASVAGMKKADLCEKYEEALRFDGEEEGVIANLVSEAKKMKKKALQELVEEHIGKPWHTTDKARLLDVYFKALEDAGPGLNCYSYNGSRFDMVDVVHTLAARMKVAPENYLKSNGKVISFTWNSLHFKDLCLITMCPLASACKSYGVKTAKGYLPHSYLQKLPSLQAILDRLHGTTNWRELEPHIDWMHGAKVDEIQKRVVGQSFDEWLRRKDKNGDYVFPLREDWEAKTGPFSEEGDFAFAPKMVSYLEDDVRGTHEVLEQVGGYYKREYGCDIRVNCTVGSLATKIWKGTLPTHVNKIIDEELYKRIHDAVKGGFCGPLGHFDFTVADGQFIYKVDVTSLYPASTVCDFFRSGPGSKYFRGFPQPGLLGNKWETYDFEGAQVEKDDENYELMMEMHGFAEIQFDQSEMDCPILLSNLKEGSHQTLTRVIKGSGRYSIPLIQQAIDNGCRVWMGHVDFVRRHFNPFPGYMDPMIGKKNRADAVLALLKDASDLTKTRAERKHIVRMYAKDALRGIEELTQTKLVYPGATRSTVNELANRAFRGEQLCPTRSNKNLKASADVTRTVSKLLVNSLLGRLDMAIDRTQTTLTQSEADKRAVMQGKFKYREPKCTEVACGAEDPDAPDANKWFKLTYREGGFYEHVKDSETAPHLWATMLDYSKILMNEAFLWLARNDCEALYTDTDSIAFAGTPDKYAEFMEIFGSDKKQLGAFEAEHKGDGYHRLITIGPKKYIVLSRDEDGTEHMEWKGNGIQAKENAETAEGTMLDTFEAVLNGEVCEVDYFRIGADSSSQLNHTVDAKKKLRFLCLKGRCIEDEDGKPHRIEWWDSAEEFSEYAKTIKTALGVNQ